MSDRLVGTTAIYPPEREAEEGDRYWCARSERTYRWSASACWEPLYVTKDVHDIGRPTVDEGPSEKVGGGLSDVRSADVASILRDLAASACGRLCDANRV